MHLTRVVVGWVEWRSVPQQPSDESDQNDASEPDIDELFTNPGAPSRLSSVWDTLAPPLVPDPHGHPAQKPRRLEGAQEFTHLAPLYVRVSETWHASLQNVDNFHAEEPHLH